MKIQTVRLEVQTETGLYGFHFEFSDGLTIVRGANSSGKSTFFNTMLYGLGMEELVGGRDERVLPYAVKEFFDSDGTRINIQSSAVYVGIQNRNGQRVVLRRSITSATKSTKLVEVFDRELGESDFETPAATLYLHDPGSAQKEAGFFYFLERFLGLELPIVPTTNGGEARLYIQTVFAALAVEQKRGWTDYIANIPFFGIRDSRSRVVEFLLGLDVFEHAAERNRLAADALATEMTWANFREELRQRSEALGVAVEGLPVKIVVNFDSAAVSFTKKSGSEAAQLNDYLGGLREEYEALRNLAEHGGRISGELAVHGLAEKLSEVREASVAYDQVAAGIELKKGSLRDYQQLLSDVRTDLERNRVAKKLSDLGAEQQISIAEDVCPTCRQHLNGSLLLQSVAGPQMDLETNIGYLESQLKMLERQVVGLSDEIRRLESGRRDIALRLSARQNSLNALRGDILDGSSRTKSAVRRQVEIESEVSALQRHVEIAAKLLEELRKTSVRFGEVLAMRRDVPDTKYSDEDLRRISVFEKMFRANAGSFGYESAAIGEIEINRDNLVPFLAQLELRQIRSDIKSDSSASDFVRLIWSYLLALYQTSSRMGSRQNHPGLLCFDEPGQHSMAEDSQRALLQHLASEAGLQAIVAASFDESESVFLQATRGVDFSLISWDGKLIRPMAGAFLS